MATNNIHYKNALNRIRTTIDDLKTDIHNMQQVRLFYIFLQKNENAFNHLISSIPQTEPNNHQSNSIPNQKLEKQQQSSQTTQRRYPNHSYETEQLMNEHEHPLNEQNINEYNDDSYSCECDECNKYYNPNVNNCVSNEENEFINQSLQYEIEIMNLKKEIKSLTTQNVFLKAQLNEQEFQNEELLQKINETNPQYQHIINKVEDMLNTTLNSTDNKSSDTLENIKLNYQQSLTYEQFIIELKELYYQYNNTSNQVDIHSLWQWVNELVNQIETIENDNNKLNEHINLIEHSNGEYRNYCHELISNLGLNSIEQLQGFINDLLVKKTIDQKRVRKLRKVLIGNGIRQNDSNINMYDEFNELYQQ